MIQKTITVRRANNHSAAKGRHVTLTNVRNDPDGQFGFGVTDEGEEVYIPALVVRGQQMTEADIGAGFTCPLKINPRAAGEHSAAPWVALNPITWDDQNPEQIVVDVPTATDVEEVASSADFDALVDEAVKVVDLIGPMDETFQQIGKVIQGLQHIQTQLARYRDGTKRLASTLDEVAPEQ